MPVSRIEIYYWRCIVPTNLKVLRLIEEGRENPAEVALLLRQAIRNALSAYDDLKEAMKRPLPDSAVSGVRGNDPYYAKHRRYRSHSFERDRIHFVLNASSYILANIGELDGVELLRAWIIYDKSPYRCRALEVWLIDCWCNSENGRMSTYAAKHRELTGGKTLSGEHKRMARWNAPWELRNRFLLAANVDTSSLPTIEVLDIPHSLTISNERQKQIIDEFLKATIDKHP